MAALDPRLLQVSVDVRGERRTYSNIAITATGTRFANPNQGECNITLANLEQDVVNFILTETTPFNRNRTPKRVIVEAGRQSSGLSLVYVGDIFRSSISQPPDAVLSIRALSSQFDKGTIVARETAPLTTLQTLAQQVADDLSLPLTFEADDKQISNYTFTGAVIQQVNKLQELASLDVYIDNDQLIVKNREQPLAGRVRTLDADSGMIGVPTFTEQGARVTFFYDAQTALGGRLDIVSRQYPALTGQYVIYKLVYQLANRDIPFYYTADCRRLDNGG